jgi:hypothetical protein
MFESFFTLDPCSIEISMLVQHAARPDVVQVARVTP